jgi:hypothetical protein
MKDFAAVDCLDFSVYAEADTYVSWGITLAWLLEARDLLLQARN